MNKTFLILLATFLVAVSVVFGVNSTDKKVTLCPDTEDCVCCPCTPDCQPGDENCSCPPECES